MNDNPLNESIERLLEDVCAYRADRERWWKYNHGMSNTLIILSVLASVGATVSGAWGRPHLAATLAACSAGIIALQGSLKYTEKAHNCDLAMIECDRLAHKLKFQTKTPSDFDWILDAFHKAKIQNTEQSAKARGTRTRKLTGP